MIVLSGATLVLPDRLSRPEPSSSRTDASPRSGPTCRSAGSHSHFAFHDHYIVPGFIDVHVHGVEGVDTLDDRPAADSVATIAGRAAALRRRGVLSDDRGLRAGAAPSGSRSSPARAGEPRVGECAGAAGASREQLHQP